MQFSVGTLREQAEREKKYDAELERHIREKKRAPDRPDELGLEVRT